MRRYLILLPLLAAVVRAGALPGWWLPELALLTVPLRIYYWEKGGGRLGDFLGGALHVSLFFSFLTEHVSIGGPFAVGLILGVWWLAERWIYHGLRTLLPMSLAGALAIVSAEYFRFHFPMGGVPWGSLALGFADRPVALQWASVLGEMGLSLLVALWSGFGWALFRRTHHWELIPAPLLTLVVMLLAIGPAPTLSTVRGLAIQGNLTINEKHGGSTQGRARWGAEDVYLRQAEITWEALREHPDVDLVIWGETMFPYPLVPSIGEPGADGFMRRPWVTRKPDEYPIEQIREYSRRKVVGLLGPWAEGRTFVTGAHYYLGVANKEGPEWSPRTSEFLAFDSQGRVLDHFSKTKLVPFGENLPFGGKFPGADAIAMAIFKNSGLLPRFVQTERRGPMEFRNMTLGGAVCWENVFEKPFRDQSKLGAEAFLVLSNENWYGLSEEMDQMVAATKMRVRESGRPMLRVANTGITGLFDASGRLVGALPRGKEGYLVADFPRIPGDWTTPYLTWGWLISPLVAWLALLLAIIGRRRFVTTATKPQTFA